MHVVATAGHVDHGKSTLIRLLTGMEPDRWSDERRRGMTIDLGFAWTTLPSRATIAFVDVPGHERFVPNMLAGIGPVPAVMFVVAADEGWMPQSSEHLEALDALGVRHGLLVVTRTDLADPEPASEQALDHLRHTGLRNLPVVHVSGATGQGTDRLRQALDDLAHRLPTPDITADPRLWVDRAFTIHGAGTVVTGTLPAGSLRTGQELELRPSGRRATVRGLQSLGAPVDSVDAVARVAVNLRGLSREQVRRGDALVLPGSWLNCDVVDVRVRGTSSGELPRHLTLHAGSAAVPARVRPLGEDTARLSLASALPLRIGDVALLRDPGGHRIPAGVTVLDVRPPPLTRRGAARARAAALGELTGAPDGHSELHRRRLIRADELRAMGAQAPAEALHGGAWLLDPGYRDELGKRLTELVEQHEHAHPLEDGMPEEAARRALGLPDLALLAAVADATETSMRAGRLRLGTSPLPQPVRAALDTIRHRLSNSPFDAPTTDDLRDLGLDDKALAAAVRSGELVKLADGVYLLTGAPALALETLSALSPPFTLSQARQALGTTRRVAVPLLELLARQGHTQRLDDGRHRLSV